MAARDRVPGCGSPGTYPPITYVACLSKRKVEFGSAMVEACFTASTTAQPTARSAALVKESNGLSMIQQLIRGGEAGRSGTDDRDVWLVGFTAH